MKIFLRLILSAGLILILTNEPPQKQATAEVPPVEVHKAIAENVAAPSVSAQTATPEPTPEPVVQTPDPEAEAKAFIYFKESGNRTDAINPSSGACGIGQAWPCSKLPCTLQDYECQDRYFTSYMQQRYGTWQNAKAFWLSRKPINGKDMGNWW